MLRESSTGEPVDSCSALSPLVEVGAASPPLLCQYHEQSGKLVVGAGRNFGARGVVGGTVMLHTLLQPPAADSEKTVAIELSLTQVCTLVHVTQHGVFPVLTSRHPPWLPQAEVLWSELEGFVLPRNPAHSAGAKSGGKQGSWSTRLASVIAQLARGVRKTREEDGATSTHLTASKVCADLTSHVPRPSKAWEHG